MPQRWSALGTSAIGCGRSSSRCNVTASGAARSSRSDQLALASRDLEQSLAAAEAQEERAAPQEQNRPIRRRKINRGALPAHLPRIEVVVDVADRTCPCCAGELQLIGEDVAQRLE